jgi:glycerophosphoryl diester phosphodiesterase
MNEAVSRRALLGAVGLGAVGVVGGVAIGRASEAAAVPGAAPATVQGWAATRGSTYLIAHRGSGDVFPEHSLPAYQAAVAWGADCLEISVNVTSDGVLICLHDKTYDRTTNAQGATAAQPSTILRSIAIVQPELGPAWATEPLPRVPLLDEVFRTFGGRVVFALEAKNDAAYPAVMALVEALGLQEAVIVKLYSTSRRIAQAKAAGYPVFGYLGAADATVEKISALAAKLDPAVDYFGIPAGVSDSVITQCVATGIPVWVYAVHRRSELAHYRMLGVKGSVCSSYGYLSSSNAVALADTWASKAVASGEMSRSPGTDTNAPTWTGTAELSLGVSGSQQFLTLGQMSPVASAAQTYRVQFEASWTSLPADRTRTLTLVFGHVDDGYYQDGLGLGTGYQAVLGADGALELYLHTAGQSTATRLASVSTPAPSEGAWVALQLDVTPSSLTWTRNDLATPKSVTATDSTARGGYLHLGRSTPEGVAAFRTLLVTNSP